MENPIFKWRIRGYPYFWKYPFWQHNNRKNILKQRWPQNGPGENRHQKRTQSFYLKMENDKFRTSVNMFFFANMRKCQAWFDMKCDINDIHMQKMGTFSFQPPVFGMFVDETSLLSWRRSRLSRQSRIVWDRPWRSWGLGWCAADPLAALFWKRRFTGHQLWIERTPYVFKEIRPLPSRDHYLFSHHHGTMWTIGALKWFRKLILEIQLFSTEPWLWELRVRDHGAQ